MEIEVVYAVPDKQTILQLNVAEGTTIEEAIKLSGLVDSFVAVGIFGKIRSLNWVLKAGDRVELYRPLRVDPKVARLERAKKSQKNKKPDKSNNKD